METLRISIVIPVYNGGPDLKKCMAAIARLSYPVHECILVDDASTDGETARVADRFGATMIQLPEQGGPARARNLGVEAASGEIIFFVDADVLVHTDTLSVGVNVLEDHPQAVAVFGSYDDQPGHPSFLSQYRNLLHHWVHQTGNAQASTFWTGCGLIRRDCFQKMGGFRTTFQRPSIEDVELGLRLYRSGHEIRLEKSMLCKHQKQWTFWNMVKTDIFRRGIPWVLLLLNNPGTPRDLNLSFNSRLATMLAGLLALCVILLPLFGHTIALAPATIFLLASSGCILLTGERGGNAPVAAIPVIPALGVYFIFPDPFAFVPMLFIFMIIWTQLAFFRYLVNRRNSAFAIAAIPVQIVFFLGCALAGGIGVFQHFLGTNRD